MTICRDLGVTRRDYLAQVIRLYLEAPDTPDRPSQNDWAIAGDLFRRGIHLDHLAHAIRIAKLRRTLDGQPRESVHSLAYYRAILRGLNEDALDPGYIDYVRYRYEESGSCDRKPRLRSQHAAHSRRR